jgi:two-component system, sensor histidine kinase and response regulator
MARLLIIDDEEALREELADILRFEGYDVDVTSNGRHGVELASSLQPDLIICDLMMPGVDGYGVLQQLQSQPHTRSIPVILLTAQANYETWRKAMEHGADDYITKPINHTELLKAIEVRLVRYALLRTDMTNALESAKKSLTRMVAHELRTPLISINMVQEIISRKLNTINRTELVDLLAIMNAGSRRMSHLVEQMVFLMWPETQTLTAETIADNGDVIRVWELMTATVNQARQFASRQQNHPIETEYHDDQATILGNQAALKHGLAELVANALDFSAPRTPVHIRQWIANQHIVISIFNDGKGIPAGKINQVSQPYLQIDRDKQEQQGLGLGFPLAAQIIAVHGGSVQIGSVVNEGTQVTVQLPRHISA